MTNSYKLVPLEPTEEMYLAYRKATSDLLPGNNRIAVRFKAMVKAAPQEPESDLVKAAREALRLFNIILVENKKARFNGTYIDDDLMLWIGSCMGQLGKSLPAQPDEVK